MKVLAALLAALAAHLSVAQRVLPIPITRADHGSLSSVHRRASYTQNLNNNVTGGGYYADVTLGTPPQSVRLILDTGSADVWVLSSQAQLCQSQIGQLEYGYCLPTYNPSSSSTYSLVSEDGFVIRYLDQSQAIGDYIKDDFHIGGATVSQLQMGLATKTSIPTGIIGIGFTANESTKSKYPNLLDLLVSEGLIASKAYSLYLNDYAASTGSILFGGIDRNKFIGQLTELQLVADQESGSITSFTVALQSFSLTIDGQTKASSSEAIPVVLDSGTTWTYLPTSTAQQIYDALGAYDDTRSQTGSGFVFVDCKHLQQNITLNFQFGSASGPVVAVPIDEVVFDNVAGLESLGLDLPADLPFAASSACTLGLTGSDEYFLLGDTFLRSAYVVYDLANSRVALAQANFNSTDADVVEISSGAQNLPDVTGVQSQVQVTQTVTGLPGLGGEGVTGSATGSATSSTTAPATSSATSSATSTTTVSPGSTSAVGSTSAAGTTAGSGDAAASTSGNAGIKAIPAPEFGAVWVTVVVGFAVLTGGAIFSF